MGTCTQKFGSLACRKLVVQKKPESFFIHCVQFTAHVIGRTVGGNYFYSLQSRFLIQPVYIFKTQISVKLVRIWNRVEIGSDAFQKFLNLLGDTITLKGWTGYRGGLDTKSKLASSSILLCFVEVLFASLI